jgi:signal peptide peptidase SppA
MTLMNKAMLAKRLSNKPLLLDPNEGEFLRAFVENAADMAADKALFMDASSDLGGGKPYAVDGGIAVIPVHGMLLHKVDMHYPGWFTGYGYVEAMVDAALADPDVRGIALDVASHGGEVSGAFEAAKVIRDARAQKPVYAVVDGYAHSAGYALASAADKIFMSETASVGSVGVVTMHVDFSKALAESGVKVTYIYAGKQKVDGNPYEPLAEDVKGRIQARVQKSYEVFVASVAEGRRGAISPEAIRGTEAGTFAGPEALDLGLVDAVMSPREAFAAFKGALTGARSFNSNAGAPTMSADNADQQPVAPEVPTTDAASVKASERQRIAAIQGCEEAAGRESLASHLAFNTEMSVEDARAVLAAAPKAGDKAAGVTGIEALDKAMEASGGTPAVGADAGQREEREDPVARILGNYALASGRKLQ